MDDFEMIILSLKVLLNLSEKLDWETDNRPRLKDEIGRRTSELNDECDIIIECEAENNQEIPEIYELKGLL